MQGKREGAAQDEYLSEAKGEIKLVVDRKQGKAKQGEHYSHNGSQRGPLAQDKEGEKRHKWYVQACNKTSFADRGVLQAGGLQGVTCEQEQADDGATDKL